MSCCKARDFREKVTGRRAEGGSRRPVVLSLGQLRVWPRAHERKEGVRRGVFLLMWIYVDLGDLSQIMVALQFLHEHAE